MKYCMELQDYVSDDRQLSVLVVDDSAAVRAAIRQVLELVNITTHDAANGKDALKSVYDHVPDLVVLDVEMPGMSGMSVLSTIRNSYSKIELPVVMVTPNDSSSEVVRALDMGANDFVAKPLDLDVFWARISNQLMQKQAAEYMSSARQQLEQQVRQRTAELDAINTRLSREIKERTIAQARLKKQANYDQLTGLPNRHLAVDRLKQVIIKAQRQGLFPCVAYLDLDNFKYVNDTLGHAAGDELLREASSRLSACARKSDTVARLGGDEFLLILDDDGNEPESMREHAVSTVGDRILESFADAFILEGKEVAISPSIGFAIYGKDGDDGEMLMRHADVSMYRSKKQGKNTYCFYSPEMMAKTRIRQFVETHLFQAFQQSQLGVNYQPIMTTEGSETQILEASLYWNNNDMGFISPEIFMPVAEDTGLITPVGEWMIDDICSQLARWNKAGYDKVRVALNLTTRQLHDDNLIAVILKSIRSHGLDGDELVLMVSEEVVANDNNTAAIGRLVETGSGIAMCRFGIDDYSIASIQKHNFELVITDRGCMKDIDTNSKNRDLIKALSALAGALDVELVASGVEDEEQLQYLASVGCHLAQGVHLGEPMGADRVVAKLSRSNVDVASMNHLELVSNGTS